MQVRAAIDYISMVVDLIKVVDHHVVFIPNVAHELLDDILHRDKPLCPAEFIDDDRHVGFCLLQGSQQVGNLYGPADVKDLLHHLFDIADATFLSAEIVLFVNDSYDFVNGIGINGQARLCILEKNIRDFLKRAFLVDANNIHTRRQNIVSRQVVKFDR